jgi:predicted deacetylase
MPPYASLPESEHRERLERARRALANAGFDGAIVVAPTYLLTESGLEMLAGGGAVDLESG